MAEERREKLLSQFGGLPAGDLDAAGAAERDQLSLDGGDLTAGRIFDHKTIAQAN